MPETLTESFCERCGTRYTFESAAPKQRMRGMRVLSRGFKNFVLDDKTSFDEAMAAARMDTDRESTNAQLDAFHSTFNFCMDCRQYTCPNCWNEAEGRCLGCAPMLGDVAPAAAASPFMAPVAHPFSAPSNGTAATNGHALVESDAEFDPLARLAFLTAATAPEPEVDSAPAPKVVAAETEVPKAEPRAIAETEPVAAAEPEVVAAEPEPVAAEAESIAQTEPVAPAEPQVDAEPEAAAELETAAEPELLAESEPVAAAHLETDSDPVLVAEPDAVLEAPFVPISVPHLEADPDVLPAAAIATDPLDQTPGDAAAAALRTSVIFSSVGPGESLDETIAAFDEVEFGPGSIGAAPEASAVEPEPVVAVEPEAVGAELEPVVVAAVEPEPVVVAAVEPEPVVAEPAPAVMANPDLPLETEPEPSHVAEAFLAAALMHDVEPDFDDEPEPVVAAAPEPQPIAAEPEPEPVVAAEPEPVAAAEPEPVAAAEPEPVVAAEPVAIPPTPVAAEPPPIEAPAIAATAAPVDVVAQPTWTVIAPDPATVAPGEPEWPSHQVAAAGLPFLGRPAVPTGGVDALWAASSEQVGAASPADRGPVTGVQECVSCGLSLSATARFCRRCGSAQHA